MRRISNLILLAVAMLSLAACSDDNLASVDNNSTATSSNNVPVNFGVYNSVSKDTRAGVGGAIDTEKLKDCGFGVFAVNTGTVNFADSFPTWKQRSDDNGGELLLSEVFNYMLNEKVSYQGGGWRCGTTKYWPNPTFEDANGPEKSQYVTFLAYAPYVERTEDNWDILTSDIDESEGGILGFLLNQTYYGYNPDEDYWYQPNIYYSIMPVEDASSTSGNTRKQVDLLWGTAGNNGKSWDGNDQEGKNFGIFEPTIPDCGGGNSFNTNYKVNADLTKMTTNGSVSFNFKHALASIGGNVPNGTNPDNSFTIDAINDVVREDGSETTNDGSDRNNSTTGLKDDNRISVNWIVIEVKDKNEYYNKNGSTVVTHGLFNPINGEWSLTPSSDSHNVYYVIGKKTDTDDSKKAIVKSGLGIDVDDNSSIVSVNMNDNICLTNDGATYESLVGDNNGTFTWLSNTKNGVTTTQQNPLVEGSDPLLFIPDYDGTAEITVAVDYDIVCPDKAFDDDDVESHKGYTIAHQMQKATVSFTDKMKINTKYNLHLHLGVNSMKVSADVSDWGVASQDVDLPANTSSSNN